MCPRQGRLRFRATCFPLDGDGPPSLPTFCIAGDHLAIAYRHLMRWSGPAVAAISDDERTGLAPAQVSLYHCRHPALSDAAPQGPSVHSAAPIWRLRATIASPARSRWYCRRAGGVVGLEATFAQSSCAPYFPSNLVLLRLPFLGTVTPSLGDGCGAPEALFDNDICRPLGP